MRALESEFAFTLKTDLPPEGAPYDEAAVLAAIDTLHPAIEVSDSRYRDWTSVGGPALIADNTNDGAFVLGDALPDWRDLDLAGHQITLSRNGEIAATGSAAEVITGPYGVLVWLADECARKGKDCGLVKW